MKKYLCMEEICDFCTPDIEDAMEHVHSHPRHTVLEVEAENGEIHCQRIESPEMPEVGEEEEI